MAWRAVRLNGFHAWLLACVLALGLSCLVSAGVVGVIVLPGLCAWLMRNAWRPGGVRDPLQLACAIAFMSPFLYQGLAGSFEDARHLWLLTGLLAGLACRPRPAA